MTEENTQPQETSYVVADQQDEIVESTSSAKNASGFANLGLTKRNEDFMFQLNKHLDAAGMAGGDKRIALEEVVEELKAGQKTGQTAKQLFGTASAKAATIASPKRRGASNTNDAGYWANALDTALMFFAMFSAVFGIFLLTSKEAVKAGASTPYGILSLILTAATGGLVFASIQSLLSPRSEEDKKPLWYRIVGTLLAVIVWMALYMLFAFIPSVINPILPAIAYLVLAVAGFAGFIYERRITGISGGMFGGPTGAQPTKKR
jgi:uncharacterized membrane-anchored protein